MITNKGKEIISKYLLGQTATYASHISIGCGATPLDLNDASPSASTIIDKKFMEFEMTRVPIISKGFINDNGIAKISLTAELPKEDRYDITEIGLWSSGNNSLAKDFDSRMIFNFSEPWQAHDTAISQIPGPSETGIIGSSGDILINNRYFRASTNDNVFSFPDRKLRNEGPRFLNSKILLRGDSSIIQGASGQWTGENPFYSVTNKSASAGLSTLTIGTHFLNVGDSVLVNVSDSAFDGVKSITARTNTTISYYDAASATIASVPTNGTITFTNSTHIHLNNINFDISKNAPSDKILLAFSLIDADGLGPGVQPDYVKILLEFYRNETSTTSGYAKAEIQINGSEFINNRYKVIEIPISSLITSPDFASQQIRIARIFSSVIHTLSSQQKTSPSHYVELEGLRIENDTTENPVYGMVGYSIVRNTNGIPIYKFENTDNYVEFRFNLDVG